MRSQLADVLQLEDAGGGRFIGANLPGSGGAVFGGQLLAQVVAASAASVPDKTVKSLHTVFTRPGDVAAPIEFEVDVMHAGRAFASATVSARQGERLCCRSLVLLEAGSADRIRHASVMPAAPAPDEASPGPVEEGGAFWQFDLGGVDISDPALTGPAELNVWCRFPGAATGVESQAMLAYASDGFLIATAMRPHPGIGQSMAHVSVATTVLTHTLTFHEPFEAADWLLLAHESPYAGGGRSYGRAHVFTRDGVLVASYVQENMIRDLPPSRP